MASQKIFADIAPLYRAAGFWPRPVAPNTKASLIKGWQKPDPEVPAATLDEWLLTHGSQGIGLLMGSPFPDGTKLGAIDVDRDEYVDLAQLLLKNPICGRFGSKGGVFFVRIADITGNPTFSVKGPLGNIWGKPVECLFTRKLCVIPPTIHPSTKEPYRWFGPHLLDVDFNDLPILGE